jgi:hypothetical protein
VKRKGKGKETTSCIMLHRCEETKEEKKKTIKSHDATAIMARKEKRKNFIKGRDLLLRRKNKSEGSTQQDTIRRVLSEQNQKKRKIKKNKKYEGYTSYVLLLEEKKKQRNNKANVNSRWEEGKDKTKRIQEVLGREVGEYLLSKEITREKTGNFKVNSYGDMEINKNKNRKVIEEL